MRSIQPSAVKNPTKTTVKPVILHSIKEDIWLGSVTEV